MASGWVRRDAEALTEPADSSAPSGGPIIRVHPRCVISFGVDPDVAGSRAVF